MWLLYLNETNAILSSSCVLFSYCFLFYSLSASSSPSCVFGAPNKPLPHYLLSSPAHTNTRALTLFQYISSHSLTSTSFFCFPFSLYTILFEPPSHTQVQKANTINCTLSRLPGEANGMVRCVFI